MASTERQSTGSVWALTRRQHAVVTHEQLLELGLSRAAIKHRAASGRLHRVHLGVYAVGSPWLSQRGKWMAAVLRCGPAAALSDLSAASLWEILPRPGPPWRPSQDSSGQVEVVVPPGPPRVASGIVVHRRGLPESDLTRLDNIPTTTAGRTLIDLATRVPRGQLEAAIGEADKRGLVTPDELRLLVQDRPRVRGVGLLKEVIESHTFRLTDSELERKFLSIVRAAGLPLPQTGAEVNGFKVDFFWAELGLVVETDGLTYHRTPAQQARDRLRDQAHAAAGLTTLRFTHAQVSRQPRYVQATLAPVARRLSTDSLPLE